MSATIDKADFGVLMFRVGQRDLDSIKHIINNGFNQPNFMTVVYKNRDGDENDIIVWSTMNHGTMREEVLFITNKNYELVNSIKPIEII